MSRVVLVTGGANGIGWAVCRRFASAGDRVVVADLDRRAAEARAVELGGGALGLLCDVASPDAARTTVAACIARFGRLDVLINNAGIIDSVGTPAVDTPLSAFRRLLGVNLSGAYAMAVAAKAVMPEGEVIINLASAGGFVATPLRTAYGSSKAGVMALTRALAREWARDRIRVNAVAPGYIRTPLIEQLIASGKVDPTKVESRVPLGRMGRPEEIAEVIFHVASAEAGCISGTTVVADGGFLAAGGGVGPFSPAPVLPPRTAGRTVVITGADSAVGAAVAAALAEAGDRVMMFGSDRVVLEATQRSLGQTCRWMEGASIDESALERMADAATSAWGAIDALVSLPAAHRAEQNADPINAFEQEIDDTLVAAFIANKVVGAHIQRAGGGAIVNLAPLDTSSSVGVETGAGAIVMLTRNLACEWAAHGVRVNAMTVGLSPDLSRVAGTVRFLISDAASYVTGAQIEVGGIAP